LFLETKDLIKMQGTNNLKIRKVAMKRPYALKAWWWWLYDV